MQTALNAGSLPADKRSEEPPKKKLKIDELKKALRDADKAQKNSIEFESMNITSSIMGIPFHEFNHLKEITFFACHFSGSQVIFRSKANRPMTVCFKGCSFDQSSLNLSSSNSAAPLSVLFQSQPGRHRDTCMNRPYHVILHGYLDTVELGYISAHLIWVKANNVKQRPRFIFHKMEICNWFSVELKDPKNVTLAGCQMSLAPTISTMFPGIPIRTLYGDSHFW